MTPKKPIEIAASDISAAMERAGADVLRRHYGPQADCDHPAENIAADVLLAMVAATKEA